VDDVHQCLPEQHPVSIDDQSGVHVYLEPLLFFDREHGEGKFLMSLNWRRIVDSFGY